MSQLTSPASILPHAAPLTLGDWGNGNTSRRISHEPKPVMFAHHVAGGTDFSKGNEGENGRRALTPPPRDGASGIWASVTPREGEHEVEAESLSVQSPENVAPATTHQCGDKPHRSQGAPIFKPLEALDMGVPVVRT